MDVKTEKKRIARHINDVVGGVPEFSRYDDKNNTSAIHIMTIQDVPEYGINMYSTVGTSAYSIGLKTDGVPLRAELMFAIDKTQEMIPDILATCAFCIINSHYECYPGIIFYDVISAYIGDSDMKHVMFVAPFLWEGKYHGMILEDKRVEWLLAVPISEAEGEYAEKYGSDALEELFEKNDIDIFDMYRKSVI